MPCHPTPLQVLSNEYTHWFLITTLWGKCYHYPCCTDEGTEVQRGERTCQNVLWLINDRSYIQNQDCLAPMPSHFSLCVDVSPQIRVTKKIPTREGPKLEVILILYGTWGLSNASCHIACWFVLLGCGFSLPSSAFHISPRAGVLCRPPLQRVETGTLPISSQIFWSFFHSFKCAFVDNGPAPVTLPWGAALGLLELLFPQGRSYGTD